MAGKLVELLKEMAPQLARVALLFNPENISAAGYQRSIETVAKSLGVIPVWFPVRNAAESKMPSIRSRASRTVGWCSPPM